MKKIITYIAVLCIFTACNNDEIGIKYELTAVIDGTSLVENLVDPNENANFFPLGKLETNYSVRTTYLIYDDEGSLIEQEDVISESFFDKVTVSKMLEVGTYTVITVMDVVYKEQDCYWKFDGLTNIESASITLSDNVPDNYGVLGFHKEIVSITNGGKSLSIIPEHLGALYVTTFYNVDYNRIRYIYHKYDLNPDTYQMNTNNTSRVNTLYANNLWNNGGTKKGVYYTAYLLPNNSLDYDFELLDINQNSINTYSIPFDVVAGDHKNVTIDLSQLTFDISPLSKIKTNISDIVINKSISIDKMGYSLKINKK